MTKHLFRHRPVANLACLTSLTHLTDILVAEEEALLAEELDAVPHEDVAQGLQLLQDR